MEQCQSVVGRPRLAHLFPPSQLSIEPFQPGCSPVPPLASTQGPQSSPQCFATPVSPFTLGQGYRLSGVRYSFFTAPRGQQLLGFFPSLQGYPAQVIMKQVAVAQLVRRPLPIDQLQFVGNCPVSVADQLGQLLRSSLPGQVYGFSPSTKVAQSVAQVIPNYLQFQLTRASPHPQLVRFQYLAPQLRLIQHLLANPAAHPALHAADPLAGLTVTQPQGRQLYR